MAHCAENGYFELLQWARGQPDVAEEVLCGTTAEVAAFGGQIGNHACMWATRAGQTETLHWLLANGVPE